MATLADIIADVKPRLMPTAKVAVRVTDEYFDLEVEAAVEGALSDLKRVGISEACFSEDSDFYPMVRQAVVMYCKAHFGQDNPNEEMRFWMSSYEMHVDALLNSGANTYAVDEDEEPAASDDAAGCDGPSDPADNGGAGEVDPDEMG